jgi:hypothetical protein
MTENWTWSKGELHFFFCSSKQNSQAFVYYICVWEQWIFDEKENEKMDLKGEKSILEQRVADFLFLPWHLDLCNFHFIFIFWVDSMKENSGIKKRNEQVWALVIPLEGTSLYPSELVFQWTSFWFSVQVSHTSCFFPGCCHPWWCGPHHFSGHSWLEQGDPGSLYKNFAQQGPGWLSLSICPCRGLNSIDRTSW